LVRHPTVRIRGLAFDRDGRLFAAQSRARRVVWLSSDGGTYYLNAMLGDRRHNDPQDLVVDDAGRIWFTDRYTDDSIPGPVGYPPLEHQSVLRLTERDRPAGGGIGDWTVERMTFDTAAPGGIALSPDGNVVVAVARTGDDVSGRVVVIDPSGAVVSAIDVPEPPTNVCAGGADGTTLFVTTRTGRLYAATTDGSSR
jgi:gluconolactonase